MKVDLYPFQQQAVEALKQGRHFIISGTGSGKTAVAFGWLEQIDAHKVLIVSTSSKVKCNDWLTEADKFLGEEWRTSREAYDVVSWDTLHKWVAAHTADVGEYTIVLDEVAKCAAGVSSRRGRAFLAIAPRCAHWAGFTATPGDVWLKFYPYFQATGKVKNKTDFMRRFCIMQTFRGFPEVGAYLHEDKLKGWWEEISYAPDTAQMERELPRETHQVIHLTKPKGYDKVLKNSTTVDGEFLDNTMALCHYLRQMCDNKAKQEWVKDWLEGLDSPAVIFYNYNCEAETLTRIAEKLGKKVWLVNGTHHDIPTAETIGKDDVIVAHYLSGGEGLNLQFCQYWLAYSPNYSLSVSLQARGRIRRIGQTRPMHFYYLQADKTIEADVYAALSEKRDFSEDVWCIAKRLKKGG